MSSNAQTPAAPASPKPLTTANSMMEGPREKPPPLYNPFDRKQAAPLDPEDFMGEAVFKYDDFLSTRAMPRRNIHGRSEDQFDPELLRPTPAQLSKIQRHNFLEDVEEDPRLEEERGAAYVEQPPEVLAQLRADFKNPKFLAVLRRRVTRAQVTEVDTGAADKSAATASASHKVRLRATAAAHDTADTSNPDFFTAAGQYDGFNAQREERRRQEAADETLRRIFENDVEGVAILAPEAHEARPPRPDVPTPAPGEGESTLLTKAQASKLLDVNPLRMLRLSARSDLMQLTDVSAVYRLLNSIMLQHEEHRQHFNIVELVREMNVRGAKYDGCVQMHTQNPLGALVDRQFYQSFFDASGERLVGGHEHTDASGFTRLCVFKFYLVQRTAANAELLQVVDERGRALQPLEREVTADDDEMRLNRAGIYDIDLEDADADANATDTYGSMHDIRFLQKEFMLSLRLVCVECDGREEPDEEMDDDAELDEEEDDGGAGSLASETLEAGSQTLDLGADDDDTDGFLRSLERRAAEQRRTSAPARRIDESLEPETRIATEGGQGLPDERLAITLEQAGRLVGKLRAPLFQQRVNSHTIRLLCPRAFMFYAVGAAGE